jgi:hypothetical protein
VFVVIHCDHDTKKAGDLRHGFRFPPCIKVPSESVRIKLGFFLNSTPP